MSVCRGERSLNGYSNLGCRCGGCRAEWREYIRTCRVWRRSVIGTAAEPATLQHGKASTYGNWGCRCAPCTEANRIAKRDDRARAAS